MGSRILDRQLNILEKNREGKTLEKYFGLETDKYKKFRIKFTRKEQQKMELIINFTQYYYYYFVDLPKEISNIIFTYLFDYINIHLEIAYSTSYPFVAPFWSLISVHHNISYPPVNLEDYYKYIIDNTNQDNTRSPITYFEKDILEFIVKINHFEYIL